MTDLGWPRVEAIMHQPVFTVDDTQSPASAVGGTTSDALPTAGLREAQAIRDAFASVGWSIDNGHEFALTAGFECDGVPTSFSFSFDRTPRGIRSWVTATATVMSGLDLPSTLKERELLAAVMDYAENPFPSMAGMIRMGRELTYPDVDEAYWPQPYAQIAMDWNLLAAGPSGLRYEPMDPPVRSLLVGYHWMWIPEPTARATVITKAVDALPTVLAAIGDLQVQDPSRYSQFMGEGIPSVQMGVRWGELRRPGVASAPSIGAPTLRATGSKIGATAPVAAPSGGRFCGDCGAPRSPEHRFCGNCGAAFAVDAALSPADQSQLPVAPGGDGEAVALSEDAMATVERAALQGDTLAMIVLGHQAEERGDAAGAQRWFETAANAGHVDAMVKLASQASDDGNDAALDFWLQQAGDAGHLLSMRWLGLRALQAGDVISARMWLEPAAESGDAEAQVTLGLVEKVEGNKERARELFVLAAAAGDPGGRYELGVLALDGGNVVEAEQLWGQSAADQHPAAMWALGRLAWERQDIDGARRWFQQAALLGHVEAMRSRAVLAGVDEDSATQRHWNELAAAAGHPQALNDIGYALVYEGRMEDGLAMLAESARKGVPWALATYSWQCLQAGDYQRAVDLADEALAACEDYADRSVDDEDVYAIAPYQLANARSNIALCRLALGRSDQEALEVWEQGHAVRHLESLFYPAVLAKRRGDDGEAARFRAMLTPQDRETLTSDLEEGLEAPGVWFAAWCRESLTVLQNSLGGNAHCASCGNPVSAEQRFCGNCGTPTSRP